MANSTVYYRLDIVPVRWNNNTQTIPCPYQVVLERTDENAGYDLYCRELTTIPNVAHAQGKGTLIPLGIKARLVKIIEINARYEIYRKELDSHFWLLPRSSIYKTPLIMANSVGVIDKSYRGELMAPVRSNGPEYSVIQGERLFQIVAPDMGWIREVRIVDSLPDTVRGEGGFGSTGK
jgi:dUTPase